MQPQPSATREHPILFSAPLVGALLEGRKRCTRRLIKPQPIWREDVPSMAPGWWAEGRAADVNLQAWPDPTTFAAMLLSHIGCPYGRTGDQLWVRETWALENMGSDGERVVWQADRAAAWRSNLSDHFYLASDVAPARWRPSIHMPRWASRLTLLVERVRVERLHDVTERDILREGVTVDRVARWCNVPWGHIPTLHDAWRTLWVHLNGRAAYDANPWLWVIDFGVVVAHGTSIPFQVT